MPPPLNEQIADRITGGGLTEARTKIHAMEKRYESLSSEHRKLSIKVENLKSQGFLGEGYADQNWDRRLTLDRTWQVLSGAAQHRVIEKNEVDLYHDMMAFAYQFSPLIKAAVDIKTRYTFGQSYSIKGKSDASDEVINGILKDLRNRHAIFGAQAIAEADRELQKGGNIYLAMWIDENPVQIRLWTSYEIGDVILDPDDGDTPLYYVRTWADIGGTKTKAYPSIFNENPGTNLPGNMLGMEVDTTIVVYQMSEGRAAKQKWALSPYTSALPWNRSYEKFLEDFAAIVQILRTYATMFTTKGGEGQVASLSDQFQMEPGEPAGIGNGIVATDDNQFQVIDAGSNKIVGPQDSRYFLLQVCAATGVPENMLTGNLQTGNRASAQEMTANFLPIIEERQTLWTETLTEIFSFILGGAEEFEVSFPPIRTQDAQTYLQTLVQAVTLGSPGRLAGVVKPEDVIRAIYEALDIAIPGDQDIDALVQGIADQIATDPGSMASLDNLTQATNAMNEAIRNRMGKAALA